MNGFLERLVARAEQRAPMVERRQPGLFEPRAWDGAATAAAAGHSLEQDDGEQEAARAEGPSQYRLLHDPPSRVQQRDAAQPNTAGFRVTAVRQATPPSAANVDRSALHEARPREATSVGGPVTTSRSVPRAPAMVGPEPPLPTDTTRRRLPPPSTPPLRLQPDDTPRRARRPSVAETPPRPVPHPAALPPLSRLVTPATVPAPARARAVRLAAAVKAPPPAAPPLLPAPVQVTIGRVEVRAASPAPIARGGAQPAGPRLGLDEYLRQRHGVG